MSSPGTLNCAIPILPVSHIARSMDFYADLGFERVHEETHYGILNRDAMELHLWSWEGEPLDPKTNADGCRFIVSHIEALYETFKVKGVVHPNGHLESKPWATREFAILDPGNNLVVFVESTV